ncbi:MAG: hypothetical protein KKF67_00285 [Nanoarchaeota archaeon]|nr:hypothetical protein [Nanoarchaeota archaeon]
MVEEIVQNLGTELVAFYNSFIGFFPPIVGSFINFVIFVLLIVVYAIIVWNGYRFISQKDPLNLGLSKYNKAVNPLSERILAGFLYFIEYIIIIPFVIVLVLAFFMFFLIVLSPNINTLQILLISSIIIAAIRMTSYYKEGLSQEISKILPLILLATFVINPAFISSAYFEKIILNISQIPGILSQAGIYLLFIVILEAILRFFDFIFSLMGVNTPEAEIKEE